MKRICDGCGDDLSKHTDSWKSPEGETCPNYVCDEAFRRWLIIKDKMEAK